MRNLKKLVLCIVIGVVMLGMYCNSTRSSAANPYMPLWEHIPDGEPYVFEDPDNPGKYRLYVYGSHDTRLTDYCGYDFVAWSAPVENLNDWRCDGIIFESVVNGKPDVLFAPDVALKVEEDGSKTYYLYPNNQSYGRNGMVAKSDSPIGPFEVCNWKEGSTTANDGVLGFDPAVFVDDDGRVYGYWGFQESYMAELDPETMATVKEGCEVLTEEDTGIDDCNNDNGTFRFFEASSIRKVTANGQTKYVFVYSRKSLNNEFGVGASNATLAYAYSDNPLGPWTYGGTIVDARARDTGENGKPITTMPWGNTHGSIVEVNGQWYIFYHRCINRDQYSRQATAEPIELTINDAGEVIIPEVEVTSQGIEADGLNPFEEHSAGITCYMTGSSYVKATYDKEVDSSPVVDNKKGDIVGYKYFNFDKKKDWQTAESFKMSIMAKGIDGEIKVMLDSPWESQGGTQIALVDISAYDDTSEKITKEVFSDEFDKLTGTHALFFVFSATKTTEIAEIHEFEFTTTGTPPSPSPTPAPTVTPTASPVVPTLVPTDAPTPNVSQPKYTVGDVFNVDGYKYKVTNYAEDGTATVAITGVSNKKLKSVKIPATVTSENIVFKVTEIGDSAFKGLKKLKSVTIGKNVIKIGKKAFYKCKALKKITISSSEIKKVGASSLKGIYKKAIIKVPKSEYKKYVKLFKGKGQSKKVKIKK